jgi:hypothetical protein
VRKDYSVRTGVVWEDWWGREDWSGGTTELVWCGGTGVVHGDIQYSFKRIIKPHRCPPPTHPTTAQIVAFGAGRLRKL